MLHPLNLRTTRKDNIIHVIETDMQNQRIPTNPTVDSSAPPSSKRPAAIQPLLFALTLIGGMFIGTNLNDKNPLKVKAATEENPNKLVSLINFIEDNYVDTINKKELIDDAIASLLKNLDPHSYYLPAEDVLNEKEKMSGEFSGIGIEFLIQLGIA